MSRLIVLIPEGYFIEYHVYSVESDSVATDGHATKPWEACSLEWTGKIRFRGEGLSLEELRKLIGKYSPEAIAVRILYGGEEFKRTQIYDRSILERLESLAARSPLHIPPSVRLLKALERIVPTPEIYLFFETAFFANLPLGERTYAIDGNLSEAYGEGLGDIRRYGYHGLFHGALAGKIKERGIDARKILSICLEPIPEVAGIYDGKPVTVSGGSTPLEGLPGNSTCGELDPGIILLLEEKKKWGPERINEMLSRKSGVTALVGRNATIAEVLRGGRDFEKASDLLEYRILLSCGAAMSVMGGFDTVAFSGRYVEAADRLAGRLIPKLIGASSAPFHPALFFMQDTLDRLIAESYCRSRLATTMTF